MTSRRKLALTAFVATLVASLVSVGTSASFNGQGRNPTGVVSTDALDAPTGLIASGGSTASLSWTATPDTYASGYRIFRGTASGGPYTQIDQVTPRTNTTFVDSPGNGTYYYVVRAFYQSWESVNSNQASATVAVGIAYDSSSSTTGTGGSLTWSHTVGSDSNRVLVVGVSIRKSAKTVTNVTYGGVGGFTQAGTQTFDGSDHRVEIWYQLMPAVGTANVVVTLSAAEDAVAGAVSYGGVHQTTPLGTFTGAGGNNQAPTVDIASRADEVVLGLVSISGDHNGMTLGGGQTQRWTGSTGTGDGAEFGAGSTEPGADSVTMSWSAVNSNRWAIGAVAVKPATVVSPAAPSGLGATGLSSSEISLSWTDNSTNEDGFKIERSPAGQGSWSEVATVGAGTTTYLDTGLTASTAFDYRVRAHNAGGNSPYSNVASATTASGAGGVAVDNTSSTTGTGSSLTWSHTVGSGSNRVLIVGVSIRKSAKTVTNVTYGGVDGFTQAGTQTFDATDHRVEIWYKIVPTIGTANIVVTLSGAEDAVAGAVSFTGVHQTTPLGTFTGAGGNNQTPTVDVASDGDELVLAVVSISGDHNGMTLGGGQTQRWSESNGTSDGSEFGAASTKPGQATVTMLWSAVNANKWA
ncbi:MAG TPA: fibronectin type III domain-containing protein, partial [Actinomycetota bacterium]